MANLNVQQQNIIKQLKQAYPELKNYSDEQILSLYNQQLNNVQLTEDERISIMNGINSGRNDGMGLSLETTQTSVSKEQEEQLKSALTARLNAVSTNVKKAEDSNGFLGSIWSWSKNNIPFLDKITDSSNEVRDQQKADLKALESGNIAEAFKQITGLDYTVENVNKFLNNEVQTKSETALNGYTEGQDMASDVIADMISGIAAVGIYTAAVAAAPFTGGASIAVGIVAAGASAAVIKTGIKYADAVSADREYTTDNLLKDLATGAFSGVLAPITGGMGGAVGKTVATKFGIQVVKQVSKDVAEEAVTQTTKGFVKTMLTNPTGYEYIGGNLFKRGLAFGAEAATDGAIGGAVDEAFRTAYDGGSAEEIWDATKQGFVGGLIMSPVIGGSTKSVGVAFNRIKGVDDFSSLVSNCNKLDNEDLIELYKYYKTLEVESSHKGVEIPDIKKSGFEKLMQEINARGINVDDIEIKNRYLLEGNTDPNDLTEVAPFAEHLDNKPQVGEIIIPNKDRVEMVNGDFVDGEFVPDGTSTVYPQGHTPFNKKSITWKQTSSYPTFKVAQNKTELAEQMAEIMGVKSADKNLRKNIDEILSANKELKITDLSEILGHLKHAGKAKEFIEKRFYNNIVNINRFKSNAESYAELLYKLKDSNASRNTIDSLKIFYGDGFITFLEKIDSKDFKANCESFSQMRNYLKNSFDAQKFLTTVHEQKVLDRIKILDDFNFEHTNIFTQGDLNLAPYTKIFELGDDEKYAELLERMDCFKKMKNYFEYDATQVLHHGNKELIASFKKFDSSIPADFKSHLYRYYREIAKNNPENIDKFIEFFNKMPEDCFKSYFKGDSYGYHNRAEICNLFMNFGAECSQEKWYKIIENGYWVNKEHQPKHRTPDELLKRLDIAIKLEHLTQNAAYYVDMILTKGEIKDLDKALTFLNAVDADFLDKIKLKENQYVTPKYELFDLINNDNIDLMIENAKIYNELPDNVRKLFADNIYFNEFKIEFDIPTEDFRARVDIIKKYGDILSEYTIKRIFVGNIDSNPQIFDIYTQLPEKLQKYITDYDVLNYLGTLTPEGAEKFVKVFSELNIDNMGLYALGDNLRRGNLVNLFNKLTLEELNIMDPNTFLNLDLSNIAKEEIISKRIQQIPANLRKYVKNNEAYNLVGIYSRWFNDDGSFAEIYAKNFERLAKLTDEELNLVGPDFIKDFIHQSGWKDLKINTQNIGLLKEIPNEARVKLNYAMKDLLISEKNINPELITKRYNVLKSFDKIETASARVFNSIIDFEEEQFNLLVEILNKHNKQLGDINEIVNNIPSTKEIEVYKDFISDVIINNPKNNPQNIATQLNFLSDARNNFLNKLLEKSEGKSLPQDLQKLMNTEDYIKASKEMFFAPADYIVLENKTLMEIIENSINNKHLNSDNKLLKEFYNVLSFVDEDLAIIKQNAIFKALDNPKYDKKDLINSFRRLSENYPKEHVKLVEDIINSKNFTNLKIVIDANRKICVGYDDPAYQTRLISLLSKIVNENLCPEKELSEILENISNENIALAEKLCTDVNLNFSKDQIAEIIGSTNRYNLTLAEKLCTDEKLNFSKDKIAVILSRTKHYNLTLAEKLCIDEKLNFPKDKILFMLNLNISSEISPIIVAKKAKEFFDLGLDDKFIKDIFENSESLTFYSDKVLKILQKRKIDDPDTPLSNIIKVLVGNTPNNLQDRIDALILLAKFTDDEVTIFKEQGVDVNFKIEQLEKLINAKHDLISTTQTDISTFLKAFANTKEADDVIRNADFEQFGKNGIQLQYSREEFIKRMNELIGCDFSKEIKQAENIEIPTLKMTNEDILKSKEALESFKTRYGNNTKEYDVIINGEEVKVTRFLNSKTGGSNEGDFAMIGDKLYYLKFPDETKLEQSVQEVMASELYRAAGIDAPNMKIMFNSDGTILGMASEYVPSVGEVARSEKLFDSFVTDAWLANWDAPKNDNSAMRNGTCIKMDVGGSLEYRARGSKKENFGNIVNELTSLIEQNSDYHSMTKADVLSSLKHVTNISDEQVWKIVKNIPANFRNYALGQKMLTRRDFIKKFETIFEQMDETKYNNILDMINNAKLKTINEFDSGTNIASLLGYEQTALGFEGLLNTRDLSGLDLKPQELATAQKMIKEIENFTKYNRVADDIPLPKEVKGFLNSILKGIPEFAAYFSKPQHNGTQYSLDVHILKVLQDSLKDLDYAKLNDQDKIVLKFSTLLHDIGKRYLGSNSDTGHAGLSSEYVYSILDRFKLSDDMKGRIISIVENHHWFKDFNNGVLNERTIATLARRPQDWLIYKIMAKADLVSVSEKFAIDHVKGATSLDDLSQAFEKQVAAIEEQVQLLKEKQVVVTPTKWVDVPERVKANGEILEARTFGRTTAMLDGKECEFKVLNLNEIADNEDMFKYGFNHILKKALRFIIHMPGDGSIKWFNIFKTLAKNPLNNSAQSLSMISVDNTSTYCGRQFGFILDVNNANISHAYYSNTASGSSKGLQDFVDELFENGHHRSFVKDQFIDFLKTERGIEIDDLSYAKIAEFIMSKKYPETQLINLKDLTIDNKTYKMQDILDAFTFSRDQLIIETKEKLHGSHNEMVGLNAKVKGLVAKVNTFEELPEYFLRFAKENDLPIILIGNR